MAVSVLVVVLANRTSRAADADEEQLIRDGVVARRHQDDAKALELFRRAYAVRNSPRAAGQMGLAEIALGRWLDAEAHLEEALRVRSDPWVNKNRKTLEASLGRVRQEVGTLEVLGPPGAELVLGGQAPVMLPLDKPIHVRVGELRFELRAPGRVTETRTVQVTGGRLTRETVDLLPLASASSPSPTATLGGNAEGGSAATNSAVVTTAEPDRPAAGSRPGAGLRIAGIVLAVAGAAAVGVGVELGLKARAAGRTDSRAATFGPSAEQSGLRLQTLQWVGYGVGAALLAGGVAMYIVGAVRRSPREPQVALVAAPGAAVALVGGSF